VLVIHHGRSLLANYYNSQPTDHHDIYSITKSVLSTLVGIAVSDGRLGLSQTLAHRRTYPMTTMDAVVGP
jgi:CubicO group peptidase (beta-lactamase class C family)